MLALLIAILSLPVSPDLTIPQVYAQMVPISDYSTKQIVWLNELEQCESMGSTTIRVLDTNNRYSYGILQFQMQTWLGYGKSFGATKENIYSKDLQEQVALSMLKNGGERNWWICSHRIGDFPE